MTLYNPTGEGGHQGGGVAAPVGGQILSEVLPYLEVNQDNSEVLEIVEEVSVPNVIGLNINEAKSALEEKGLLLTITNVEELEIIDKDETIVINQTPKAGILINAGNEVMIEY